MKIKRYLGKDTQEAILKVKMDLGNEAIILNTRKIKQKGFFKFFSKPMIEILAAIDEYSATKKDNHKVIGKNIDTVNQIKENTNFTEKEGKITELENKVNNMELLLKKVYEEIKSNGESLATKNKEQDPVKKQNTKVTDLFYENLMKNEVDKKFVSLIMDNVNKKLGKSTSVNDIASVLYNTVSGMLGTPETLDIKEDGKPTKILFVGPTGVGKTTTLAKIAANYSLNLKKNVGLITADTYRIAAVEQLKTYADILGMPVAVIYQVEEVMDAINLYKDKDIILIDTAGRSYKNDEQFVEIKDLINECKPDEIFLVLSATTSIRSCKDILANYQFLKDYKLIFTKLDESSVNGIILNVKQLTNKSLSYITNGQSVPDDIEVANIDKITKNILGSIN